jgi:hypothetical protein
MTTTQQQDLYTLTKNLHTLIQEKAKKHGLEVEIESDYIFFNAQRSEKPNWQIGIYIGGEMTRQPVFAIQAPQIRAILLAFEEVLGSIPFAPLRLNTKAKALCSKWLDGLIPLIDREPETVLTELLEILKSI